MNRSFAQIRIALYAIAVTFALAGAARAQQALPGIDDAQQAVDRATQADADQYAPDLIASARAHLEQAQAASMDRRAQKQVPALATQAALEADLARARSRSGGQREAGAAAFGHPAAAAPLGGNAGVRR
jgi:hypothetical protein